MRWRGCRRKKCGCTCAGAITKGRTIATWRWATSSTWCSGRVRRACRSRPPILRHAHEWALFESVKLPGGKVLIPGVLESKVNFIEHPELVAQRIGNYAKLVGRENVIAGTDCGYGHRGRPGRRRYRRRLGETCRHGRGRADRIENFGEPLQRSHGRCPRQRLPWPQPCEG